MPPNPAGSELSSPPRIADSEKIAKRGLAKRELMIREDEIPQLKG